MSHTSSDGQYIGPQPEYNLGTLGHVDNGKSTIVQALTGVWPAKHSEELRRGITIRLGYADTAFYKCPNCSEPECYCIEKVCSRCGSATEFLRALSFIDCPGHHSLMVTMLAGASLMDGALLVLDASEKCPQPQDREHLVAAEIVGIKNIVIVQNKTDIVSRKRAIKNHGEIKAFVKGTSVEDAPIIPISAQHQANMDILIKTIEGCVPTPKRGFEDPPFMYVVRSFDVNRPGTPGDKIVGGVIGGSILKGIFKVGDELEVRPGIRDKKQNRYTPLNTEVVSLRAGGMSVKEAKSGGLVGVGTLLDPSLTKSDGLVGNVVGRPENLPPVWDNLVLNIHLFKHAIGTKELTKVKKIRHKEVLVLNAVTSVTSGVVTSTKKNVVNLSLRRPVCIEAKSRVAISRRIGDSWRLIGYGMTQS